MAYGQDIINKVYELRTSGKSIRQISKETGVGTYSIFNWIKYHSIKSKNIRVKRTKEATRKAAKTWEKISAEKRIKAYEIGKNEASELLKDKIIRDFVCLYWAEGYKRSRNTVSIINTDGDIICICINVMLRFAERPLTCRLFCTEEEKELALGFWSKRIGVPKTDIKFQKKNRTSKRRAEYGLLSVSAHETIFRSRLQAWMDAVKTDWGQIK
jgi:hypothetical protein